MFVPIAFLGFLTGLAAAQEAPEDEALIRVNTRLVQVNAAVRDKNGPVGDLAKTDFTILDNGKSQRIAVFGVKSAKSSSKSSAPLPPGVVSNRLTSRGEMRGEATVILWDALNTEVGDQSYMRAELLKYLKTTQAGDLVALYKMTKTLRMVQDFTEDSERLIEAVSKVEPEQSPALDAELTYLDEDSLASFIGELHEFNLRERGQLTEARLEAIAQHLAGLPGRKKLIWLTSSFPGIKRDARRKLALVTLETVDFRPEIDRAVRRLNHANVAVYPIDARGMVVTPSRQTQLDAGSILIGTQIVRPSPPTGMAVPGIDTMNLIAAGTGGRASYATSDIAGALRTAMEDEVFYTLGFYATDEKQSGAYHDISVKVARKGLEVRSRRGAYLGVDPKNKTNGLWRENLNESMQNPLEATTLGLSGRMTQVANQPGMYSLEMTLDLADVHLERQKDLWVAALVYATRFLPSDSGRGTWETILVSFTEEKLRAALKNGYVFRRPIAAGDLKGELRVVIEDRSTGAVGSVTVPVGSD